MQDDYSRSRKEREELDHAIALSLAEDMKRPPGYKGWTDNIGDPRAPQGSLNSSAYPPYAPNNYYPTGYRICGGCNRDIGYGNYLGCMGTFFHPECFCCRFCGFPITDSEFSLSGRHAYHKSCFKELHHPKCDVCHQFIPTNGAGLIEYRRHPFWSQKYCPSHEYDSTVRCCSCERLESWNAKYVSLGDGRSLCLECMECAVMDTGDCQPLYHSIRDYYEGMNMKIDQQIPMLLVERQALNEAIVGEKNGFHHMPETRGLCLSEEQTIPSIHKKPKVGDHQLVGMKTRHQKLTRICEVTAILVLYGLPRCPRFSAACNDKRAVDHNLKYRDKIEINLQGIDTGVVIHLFYYLAMAAKILLTGAILAHELMHAWLRLKGYNNLSLEVEEGICQMLSYMWLESELMPEVGNMPSTSGASSSSSSSSSKKGRKSDVETQLGKFFMHQIANEVSPAYGGGFRAAYEAVNRYGLRRTLDHIRWTGNFPL
ncbi:unnamed protein product [Thlaspi arvense]|uniref:LIM zinc-binding domain-containing protein n=1 Tax=Thlaspi arvense TaxID=13288 RepID=A0AAU9RY96_THLAR|nr:unnamed protein product [Thlaspi arvense]